MLYEILLYDFDFLIIICLSASTRTTNVTFQKSRVLGIMITLILFCWDFNNMSLTSAYSFRISCSVKSSSMIWTYWLFLRHIDTHYKCYVSKFPCPGNHDHASFCFVGISIVFPWLWLIASEFLALWNHRLWFWRLDYYFFFKAHRHALHMLRFKIPASWESWSCLILFLLGFQ